MLYLCAVTISSLVSKVSQVGQQLMMLMSLSTSIHTDLSSSVQNLRRPGQTLWFIKFEKVEFNGQTTKYNAKAIGTYRHH